MAASRFSLLLLGLLLLPATLFGQFWMQQGGGATVEEGYAVDVDPAGNTYTTGYFSGSVHFDTANLVSSGSTDIFITKNDDQGEFLWAVRAGGPGSDRGLNIATDDSGQVYVTGFFSGLASFGSQSLVSAGLQDAFIAKYSTDGVLEWVRSVGGLQSDQGSGIAVDRFGRVVATGDFQGSVSFGTTQLSSQSFTSDVWISRLDANGNFLWTQQGAGSGSNRGVEVATDAQGNIYATGTFSDTITFDVTHNNQMFNVNYLAQFDSSGQEQWLRVIGSNVAGDVEGVAADSAGNSWVTGNFSGTLTFFGTTNVTASNPYANDIFVARYDSTGALQWATAEGSDNALHASDIDIDASGNAGVVGHFECVLNQYADQYGQGVFNAVGFSEIFVSQYDPNGNWQWSRHFGGRRDDFGYGIAYDPAGLMHFSGSSGGFILIPVSQDFLAQNLINWSNRFCFFNQQPYCNDPNYHRFYQMDSLGNLDVIIANPVDTARQPLDYYDRSGSSGCLRDRPLMHQVMGDPDSVFGCDLDTLDVQPGLCYGTGPIYTFTWSNGQIRKSNDWGTLLEIYPQTSGLYTMTTNSQDGCYQHVDSIEVTIHPDPPLPPLSDDQGVNTSTTSPLQVGVCQPDSVVLTGIPPPPGGSTFWTGPAVPTGYDSIDLAVDSTGQYFFFVTDSNGCTSGTDILVLVSPDSLPPIQFALNIPDTIVICEDDPYGVWMYDSLNNPTAINACLDTVPYQLTTSISFSPGVANSTTCQSISTFFPTATGNITITATIIRSIPCQADTQTVSKTIHAIVNPKPIVPPFTVTLQGDPFFCPGDSALLQVSGGQNYTWTLDGSTYITLSDSFAVGTAGDYQANSTVSDTNQFGCVGFYTAFDNQVVEIKPQPVVSAATNVICPNDSVLLICSNTGGTTGYFWEGPNGPIPINNDSIWVTDPGGYFCLFNDGDSCALISNTFQLTQYTTPSLLAQGGGALCAGDSVVLSASIGPDDSLVWLAPLSGSNPDITVFSPGTYTAEITSCNVTTTASVTVTAISDTLTANASGPLCEGDSVVLQASPGMASYQWFPAGGMAQSATVFDPGNYLVTSIDSFGCSYTSAPLVVPGIRVEPQINLIGDTTFCEGDSVVLQASVGLLNYLWLPDSIAASFITVNQPGAFALQAEDTNGCVGVSDSLHLSTAMGSANIALAGELIPCIDDTVTLTATDTGIVAWQWTPGGGTDSVFLVSIPGQYSLLTTNADGCQAQAGPVDVSEALYTVPLPIVEPVEELCIGDPITLAAQTDTGSIVWRSSPDSGVLGTGDSLAIPAIGGTTTYYVVTQVGTCESDPIALIVDAKDCDLISVPNVFSPNGDGLNDLFLIDWRLVGCFSCQVFNRWGTLLYEMEHPDSGWDGFTTAGEPAPDGVYFYVVEFCRKDGSVGKATGTVQLLRK